MVSLQFNLAMMTNIEELVSDKHLCMTFNEFVEAIGRVAAQLEVPHPLEDDVSDDVELTAEQRDMYNKKPLQEKIEILLINVARNVLSKGQFKQHLEILKQFKKAKVHPNHIETASLRLQ